MSGVVYEDGGALLSDSPVYVERKADTLAVQHLRRMDYITLVEPRQQGKTSLINRVQRAFPQGHVFAYMDLTGCDRQSEASWYESLCNWLWRQMRTSMGGDHPQFPTSGNSWRNFLYDLAEQAEQRRLNLVLALDEAGAMEDCEWTTDFFSAIRSVYNSRQHMPCFRHITFVIAGAFNPREMIRDKAISNFNVDHRIVLHDFAPHQVEMLVQYLPLHVSAQMVSRRLYEWTSGQPFLCQRICRYLLEQDAPITEDSVNAAITRFFHDDASHMSQILENLNADPELYAYAQRAVAEKIKFSPSVNDWQFTLANVIGILAPDADDRCAIRNRIYQQAIEMAQSMPYSEPRLPHSDLSASASASPNTGKKLSGKQLARISSAIVDGYDSHGLRQLVQFHFNEKLNNIAGNGSFVEQVDMLVAWAERRGKLFELVQHGHEDNPDNISLRDLWTQMKGW